MWAARNASIANPAPPAAPDERRRHVREAIERGVERAHFFGRRAFLRSEYDARSVGAGESVNYVGRSDELCVRDARIQTLKIDAVEPRKRGAAGREIVSVLIEKAHAERA
jgi:hypothetical protein